MDEHEEAEGGLPYIRVRMGQAHKVLWARFGEAVREAEPELDRSKVLREFMRWYVGDTDRLPRSPRDSR